MWGDFQFNAPYSGDRITELNGVSLPQSYIDFMSRHNGGEGDIGETWLVLYRMEELQEVNDSYDISDYLPGSIIIGTNGGDEFYGINSSGEFFNVPMIMDEQDITILCDDMEMFAEKVNEFWIINNS